MKRLITLALLCAALFCFAFAASAADEGLVAVAYRGDTSAYPPNSLKAIEAAFEEGADYVSVPVQKTADGAFVLLEDRALPIQCDAEEDDLLPERDEDVLCDEPDEDLLPEDVLLD